MAKYSYRVIQSTSLEEFEQNVQELLNSTPDDEGYYPIGSMGIVQDDLGHLYFQALMRNM